MSSHIPLCGARPLYFLSNSIRNFCRFHLREKWAFTSHTSTHTGGHYFHFHFRPHLLPPPDPSSALCASPCCLLPCPPLLSTPLQPTAANSEASPFRSLLSLQSQRCYVGEILRLIIETEGGEREIHSESKTP